MQARGDPAETSNASSGVYPLTAKTAAYKFGHMPNADDQLAGSHPRTSTERGRMVRAQLLEAAAELIAEIGWNAVTTRRLADHAGIRSGLVHYHFDSLQALLRLAAMSRMTLLLDETSAQLGEKEDVEDGAEALLSLVDLFEGSDPASLLVIETYLAATRDRLLREQLVEAMARFRRTLTSALARTGNPTPEATALVVLAALDGLALQKGLDPELPTDDSLALLRRIIHPDQKGTHS